MVVLGPCLVCWVPALPYFYPTLSPLTNHHLARHRHPFPHPRHVLYLKANPEAPLNLGVCSRTSYNSTRWVTNALCPEKGCESVIWRPLSSPYQKRVKFFTLRKPRSVPRKAVTTPKKPGKK